MEIWAELIQREMQRLYDLTTPVSASGSSSVSPVHTVGPGAHPAISAVQRFSFSSGNIVAGAAKNGTIALVVPAAEVRIVVITAIVISGQNGNAYEITLNSNTGLVPNALTAIPLNKRNNPLNAGPNFGFTSTTTAGFVGDQIGFVEVAATLNHSFQGCPIVLVPGTDVSVGCVAAAQTFAVDFFFETYQPQSK